MSPAICEDPQGAIALYAQMWSQPVTGLVHLSALGFWVSSTPKETLMSNAPRPRALSLLPSRFRQHPDSIAEHINATGTGTCYGTAAQAPPARAASATRGKQSGRTELMLEGCPLDTSWRLWDLFGPERDYRQLSAAERRVCARARLLRPLAHRGRIPLDWEVARDDAGTTDDAWDRVSPTGSMRRVRPGILMRKQHATVIEFTSTSWAPEVWAGRRYHECRIFVDGRLAGRGGNCACCSGLAAAICPRWRRLAWTPPLRSISCQGILSSSCGQRT